jgi:hypothetical protein
MAPAGSLRWFIVSWIVLSMAQRLKECIFCMAACGSIKRQAASRACSFSCCLQEEQGGVHPFDEARKQVISL